MVGLEITSPTETYDHDEFYESRIMKSEDKVKVKSINKEKQKDVAPTK